MKVCVIVCTPALYIYHFTVADPVGSTFWRCGRRLVLLG